MTALWPIFPNRLTGLNIQPEIVGLVRQLSCNPRLRVTIISGRKMQAIRELLPLSGIFLAGVYGVEIQTPTGELIHREEYGSIRPFLDKLKPLWETLVTGQTGFFLEDKNWSLALHALAVEVDLARPVLMSARRTAKKILPAGRFRRFASSNFLEIAPLKAHKGKTVRYLLSKFPFSDTQALSILEMTIRMRKRFRRCMLWAELTSRSLIPHTHPGFRMQITSWIHHRMCASGLGN